MPVKKKSGEKPVYQLKVTLRDIRPPIWRRIQVSSDINLRELHGILQTVMGWRGGHLHEFDVFGTSYGDPRVAEGDVLDEARVNLEQLITEEKEKFHYLYDFGDGWEHEILLEKILPLEKATQYPVCVTGKRACPPEDCGGAPGYEELLEILQDPSHPEHEEKFEWLPGDFDSEKFDAESVNRRLRKTSTKPKRTWVRNEPS
ncbi:MAG: plasmid pRiA4b ORF-3 family protein [Desulfomonilaceae bacterium]